MFPLPSTSLNCLVYVSGMLRTHITKLSEWFFTSHWAGINEVNVEAFSKIHYQRSIIRKIMRCFSAVKLLKWGLREIYGSNCNWRNWSARSTANRKVGGSTPPGGDTRWAFLKATLGLTWVIEMSLVGRNEQATTINSMGSRMTGPDPPSYIPVSRGQ